MVEKLRVGIIGAGRWAANAHLPGYIRSPLSDRHWLDWAIPCACV